MRALLIVAALAVPAAADVVTNPLQGPFATRADACKALDRGDCATLHTVTTTSSTAWTSVEIDTVADHRAKAFAIYVRIAKHWFVAYLGADGFIDTEIFPPCDGCRGAGCCAPSHHDMPTFFKPPALSFVDDQLVLFYATPNDVGFRETSPNGELIQVCRLVDHAPQCSEQVIAVPATKKRVTSPRQLFDHGKITDN